MLVAMAREEIELRLATIARYFDPGDPLYVDPEQLDPPEFEQYLFAKFDYEMAQADKSYGAHNSGYTRALLSEAVRWARSQEITCLEAWTRDDLWVRAWYEAMGFRMFHSYWHVYLKGKAAQRAFPCGRQGLKAVSVFAHLQGAPSSIAAGDVHRAHECCGYELLVNHDKATDGPL